MSLLKSKPGGGRQRTTILLALVSFGILGNFGGCRRDMYDQAKYEPFEVSDFFGDGQVSRPTVPGTIARGQLRLDDHFYLGKVDGKLVDTFPAPVTSQQLARGQQRYGIYCAQCHDPLGNGQGMVVRRGFPQPPSFHIARLRDAPVGYIFDVITNGYGRMPDHAQLVKPGDRWAIAAYVRALQKSQDVPRDQLTPADFENMKKEDRN